MEMLRKLTGPKPLPLAYFGHPALGKKSRAIATITEEVRTLAGRMIATMREHDGIGLAAPQVGKNICLIVLDIPVDRPKAGDAPRPTSPGELVLLPRMPLALVNPRLSTPSPGGYSFTEGCLSIPDVRAPVVRPEYVQLDAQLLTGEAISYRCGGLLARCLQHECDHLRGILFTSLVLPADLAPWEAEMEVMKAETLRELKR